MPHADEGLASQRKVLQEHSYLQQDSSVVPTDNGKHAPLYFQTPAAI